MYFSKKVAVWAIVLNCLASTTGRAVEKKDFVSIGGALRFNTVLENYENNTKLSDAALKVDTWFLRADAHQQGFDLSLQYRFYPDSKNHFIHHAYLGYAFDDKWYAKLGVFQRPFGIADFASHSWWLQIPYYMGLEDGSGIGAGISYAHKSWKLDLAFFRQAAPKGSTGDSSGDNSVGNGRYAYAVVPTTGMAQGKEVEASIREVNQLASRVRYSVVPGVELGLSAQLGAIENQVLNTSTWGVHSAYHVLIKQQGWSFKGEYIQYHFKALGNGHENLDMIQMAAYGSPYYVAAKGDIYVTGLAYTIPINRRFIQSIQPYIDYSVVKKSKREYFDTQHLVPGILFTSGPIYTHLDYAMGKNQPWLTAHFGEGLGQGSKQARWNGRFNLNIGYYF